MIVREKTFYLKGFISLDLQAMIILKARKIGYDTSIEEYGAGTFITLMRGTGGQHA